MSENSHGGKRMNSGPKSIKGREIKFKIANSEEEKLQELYPEEAKLNNCIRNAFEDARKRKEEKKLLTSVTMQLNQSENSLYNFYSDDTRDSYGGDKVSQAFYCNKIEFSPYLGYFEIELNPQVWVLGSLNDLDISEEIRKVQLETHIKWLNSTENEYKHSIIYGFDYSNLEDIKEISGNTYIKFLNLKTELDNSIYSYRMNAIRGFYSNINYEYWHNYNFEKLLDKIIKKSVPKNKEDKWVKLDDILEILKKEKFKKKKRNKAYLQERLKDNVKKFSISKNNFNIKNKEYSKLIEGLKKRIREIEVNSNIEDKDKLIISVKDYIKKLEDELEMIESYLNKENKENKELEDKINIEYIFDYSKMFRFMELRELKTWIRNININDLKIFSELEKIKKNKEKKLKELTYNLGSINPEKLDEIKKKLLELMRTKLKLEKNSIERDFKTEDISGILQEIIEEGNIIGTKKINVTWFYNSIGITVNKSMEYLKYPNATVTEIEDFYSDLFTINGQVIEFSKEREEEKKKLEKNIDDIEKCIKSLKSTLLNKFSDEILNEKINYDDYEFLKNIREEYLKTKKEYLNKIENNIIEMNEIRKQIRTETEKNEKISIIVKPFTYVISN